MQRKRRLFLGREREILSDEEIRKSFEGRLQFILGLRKTNKLLDLCFPEVCE
jgi:hypothetical protein